MEDSAAALPAALDTYSEPQLDLLGTALGRAMAHEVRHLYDLDHSSGGLGDVMPDLTGRTSRATFTTADRTAIVNAL